jgi:hypothetical protein
MEGRALRVRDNCRMGRLLVVVVWPPVVVFGCMRSHAEHDPPDKLPCVTLLPGEGREVFEG